jgi:hypothetical protein
VSELIAPQIAGVEGHQDDPVVDDDGNDDDLAHYARNDELHAARKQGRAVKALCGTLFHLHADPSKLPVCVVCQELAAGWARR